MIKLNKNLKNIIRNKLNKNSTRIEFFEKNQKIKKNKNRSLKKNSKSRLQQTQTR
jgi:hypothetical protein